MVQSLGISIGNLNSYVAAGQAGGIEILLNEYSNRSTPSMVAFTDRSRSIGVDASSNFFMNMKNTIYDLMVLLGKPYKELPLVDQKGNPKYSFKLEEAPDGQALVVVRHLGEERKFTITQVLAMLFTKIRGIALNARDCVISCPQFFSDNQKNVLVQAALIAGLNPLQIITDMSAVVLNYAYYRTTKQDTHKFIAFINFGQSNLQSVVAWLTPSEDVVRVLAAESEPIGGQDFDKLLADHFVREYKLDLNLKSYLKLVSACEKVKKLLSANANEIPIHVESLFSEDKDFTARIDRASFEHLSHDLLQRVESCLKRTLENAKVNYARAVAELAEKAKEAEKARLARKAKRAEKAKEAEKAKAAAKAAAEAKSAEEAKAAEGAKAAANSGETQDAAKAEAAGDAEKVEAEKIEKVEDAEMADANEKAPTPEKLPTNDKAEETKDVEMTEDNGIAAEPAKLLEVPNFDLQVVEMVGGSTRVPSFKQLVQNVFNITPSTTLNTDEAVARGCALHCATLHPGMKVKREVKILGSEFKPNSLACDKEAFRVELELMASDRKYQSTTEARNTLEEYIYAERSKLQQGDQFLDGLNGTLDWLMSDEGEDATEEEYNNKLSELKKASESRLIENNSTK